MCLDQFWLLSVNILGSGKKQKKKIFVSKSIVSNIIIHFIALLHFIINPAWTYERPPQGGSNTLYILI